MNINPTAIIQMPHGKQDQSMSKNGSVKANYEGFKEKVNSVSPINRQAPNEMHARTYYNEWNYFILSS